jgi:signal transduction histidine kinase/ActR/RegA family two-component response regulator
MSTTSPSQVARLYSILAGRRKQLSFRLGVGLCIIVFFQQLLGLPLTLCWAGLYVGLQVIELQVFSPAKALERVGTRAGYGFALALMFANALVFGSLSILWPITDGSWGAAIGAFLIAGSMLNVVLTTQESKAAFRASSLPLVIYCGVQPFAAVAVGCKPDLALGLAIGGAMLCASSFKLWNGAHKVWLAEQAARADAERRRAEAESAVAAKSAFVAMVSHELRTPISAILAGAAELERQSDGVGRSHARLISDAGSMMRTLLNDLLDLAKLDAGRMSIESLCYDFRALIADQLRFWRTEAKKQGVALRVTGAAKAPRWVRGDPTRLRQVLNNLLSNALKFTEQGSVTVGLGVTPMDDGRLSLTIRVADTGAGMTAEQVDRLFKPFEQADASVARTHGGTGLGLAISLQLARMMDGDISVTSAPGEGSCFIVTLAVAVATPTELSQAAATAEPLASGRPMAVLVVDDHEINRRAMSLMLEPLSAETTLAASGGEALSLLAARAFDVVLMDVHMPDMSGPEAVKRLRLAIGPNRRTPVIAVTGATEERDIRDCLAAGMDDWVAKPIDAGQLYNALARQLNEGGEDSAAA